MDNNQSNLKMPKTIAIGCGREGNYAISHLFNSGVAGVKTNIFSQKNFLILNKYIYVVKIKNKRKLKVYLKDYDSGSISQELAAKYLGITPRWFRQIHKIYRSTGSIPAIGVNLGRPKKEVLKNGRKLLSRNMNRSGKMHYIKKKRYLHDAK